MNERTTTASRERVNTRTGRDAVTTVSVIIPVYNRRDLVVRAVRSVITQELPPGWSLELILVDDGSTDGSPDVVQEELERWSRDDERVRALEPGRPAGWSVVRLNHGGTPGRARNAGAARAGGELLAFLDSDDRWLPGKLLRQIPLHTGADQSSTSGAAISHTRERWIRGDREISQAGKRFSRHRREGDLLEDALVKCIIGPSTTMISRALWDRTGGFREDLEVAEDYEYWLRLVTLTPVAYIDEPLTEKHAGHGDQLSEKYGQIEVFRLQGLQDLVERRWFAENRDLPAQRLAERELARKARIYAAGARKRGRRDDAERYEALAERYGPGD